TGGREQVVLWKGDMETGDLRQWTASCGGEYNNGGGDSYVSTDVARSGRYSAKMVIQKVNGNQGTRLSRRCLEEEGYYSAWYYFPQSHQTTAGWWNIFQFKSGTPGYDSDPFFTLNVNGSSDGRMRLYLRDIRGNRSHTQ